MTHTFRSLFELLHEQLDTETWWPAQSDFEICVGAILTQNTAWWQVEIAINNLRQVNALTPEAILEMLPGDLSEKIKAAGYKNIKAGYLKNIAAWINDNYEAAYNLSTEELRQSLLSVKGIGSETADDILLYVYHRPIFIYDTYARRLLAAVGLGQFDTYNSAKRELDPSLNVEEFTAEELALFHGLIVEAGKEARLRGGYEYLLHDTTNSPEHSIR